jgi:hypothetical protein
MQDHIKNIAIKSRITWLTWLFDVELEIQVI